MRRKFTATVLPMMMASMVMAGCSTSQPVTTTAAATEETAAESSEAAAETEKKADAERGEHTGDGTESRGTRADGGNRMGGARVGDRGAANQKVVLTEEQQSLIDATKGKFEQDTYEDEENGVFLDYALFIPDDYDESQTYPLIMFIPDSSAAGKSTEDVLSQYYGADIWASDAEQEKHAAFVFCPAFSETVVDDDFHTSNQIDTAVKVLNEIMETYSIDTSRVYTTGQSMGCMTSLYLNSVYPDLFAASLFVSGQWDISILQPLENAKFFYVTCSGDQKASGGQTEVMEMFDQDGISYSFLDKIDPEETAQEKNTQIQKLLEDGNQANFLRFDGLDHMSSFNYAYDLEAVRDWLFEQSR